MNTSLTLKENQMNIELTHTRDEALKLDLGIVQIENDTVTFCSVSETRGYDSTYDNFFDKNWIISAIQSHLPYQSLNYLTDLTENYYELHGKL